MDSCLPEGSLRLGEQPAQWSLSEDPEDRKDSLWIWGLFSDPLYPFLLFQLDLAAPVDFPEEATETLPTLLRPVATETLPTLLRPGPEATTRHSTRPSFPPGRLHPGGASLLPGQKRREDGAVQGEEPPSRLSPACRLTTGARTAPCSSARAMSRTRRAARTQCNAQHHTRRLPIASLTTPPFACAGERAAAGRLGWPQRLHVQRAGAVREDPFPRHGRGHVEEPAVRRGLTHSTLCDCSLSPHVHARLCVLTPHVLCAAVLDTAVLLLCRTQYSGRFFHLISPHISPYLPISPHIYTASPRIAHTASHRISPHLTASHPRGGM